MLYAIVGMLVIILDQVVKFWVDKNINFTDPVRQLIPGVISLCRVQNDGAAFSFLAGGGARVWFIVLTGIFTLAVIIALATNFISGKFGRWCLVLVTAGGLSNCIDRILYGYVLDMFKIDLFNFAVFNVADIFISVFAIAFIIYILFGGEKELNDVDEFDEEDRESEDRPRRQVKAKKERVVREAPVSGSQQQSSSFQRKASKAAEPTEYNYSTSNASQPGGAARTSMKDRTSSQEFENFFAQRRSEPEAPPAKVEKPKTFNNIFKEKAEEPKPDVKPVPTQPAAVEYAPTDPFAEWDRANGKAAIKEPEAKVNAAFDAFTEKAETAFTETKNTVENSFDSSDDFDIDSILNEFK